MEITAVRWAMWLLKDFIFLSDKEWYGDTMRTNLIIIDND